MDIALFLGSIASTFLTLIFMSIHPVSSHMLQEEEKLATTEKQFTTVKRKRFITNLFLVLTNISTICYWWVVYARFTQF